MTSKETEKLIKLEEKQDAQGSVLVEIKDELKKQTQLLGKLSVFDEKLKTLDGRVTKLENNQGRIGWFIIMAVLGSMIAMVLKG